MFLADFSKSKNTEEKKKGKQIFKPEKLTRPLLPFGVAMGALYGFEKSKPIAKKLTKKMRQNATNNYINESQNTYAKLEDGFRSKYTPGSQFPKKEYDIMNNFKNTTEPKIKKKHLGKVALAEKGLVGLGTLAGGLGVYGLYRGGKAIYNRTIAKDKKNKRS